MAISTDDPFVNLFTKHRDGGDCFSDVGAGRPPINIQIGHVQKLLNAVSKHFDQNNSRGSRKLLREIDSLLNPLQSPCGSQTASMLEASPRSCSEVKEPD